MPDLATDIVALPQDHNYVFWEKATEQLTLVFLFSDVVGERWFATVAFSYRLSSFENI